MPPTSMDTLAGCTFPGSISPRGLEGTSPYPAALCGASDLSFICDDLVFGFVSVSSSGYVWVIPSPPQYPEISQWCVPMWDSFHSFTGIFRGFHPESQAHNLQRIINHAVAFAVDSQRVLSLLWLNSLTDCSLQIRRDLAKSDYQSIPVSYPVLQRGCLCHWWTCVPSVWLLVDVSIYVKE